jgi:branched-chain amino acid transport system ATP-binding protein
MGLSPILVDTIFAVIERIAKEGMTILLVEQNAQRALEISDRAYVLESGQITIQGNAEDLLKDPRVSAAYLGA